MLEAQQFPALAQVHLFHTTMGCPVSMQNQAAVTRFLSAKGYDEIWPTFWKEIRKTFEEAGVHLRVLMHLEDPDFDMGSPHWKSSGG